MEVALLEVRAGSTRARHRNTEATVVMAGCTNGDRVDEVRVGHVGQVGHGAVHVCDLQMDERSVVL